MNDQIETDDPEDLAFVGEVISRAGFWLDAVEHLGTNPAAVLSLRHATARYVALVADREGVTAAEAVEIIKRDWLYQQLLNAAESASDPQR